MDYRSILVHLDGSARCDERVAVATSLARTYGSHLLGLAPTGWMDVPGSIGASLGGPDHLQLSIECLERNAQALADSFLLRLRGAGLPSYAARVYHGDPLPGMVQQARSCDLTVIGQTDREARDTAVQPDFPERLILQAGRPVLVLPRRGSFAGLGQKVLVAWNGSREAARALCDALPLLRRAGEVHLQYFDSPSGTELLGSRLDDSCAWLARQGVAAQGHIDVTNIDAGEALLSKAAHQGADLIVMGAYGHTRLSEFLLGGVTRTLLAQMTVPVLMSH
ncbi:universal stress protein [Aquabacterium sp. A7-Y]|uniref:universal stress protein n=1 Tax=Aquabacterium sp. A7-Y TaxID=1349605 RepID=UPI00223D3979|nr:universal stress protein [Aquabacterium sp. A7-Y]MCW7540899.1 universal stress protein [Aquabacterium sp. A7-Y]